MNVTHKPKEKNRKIRKNFEKNFEKKVLQKNKIYSIVKMVLENP